VLSPSVDQEGPAVALDPAPHPGTQTTDVGNEFLADLSDPTAGRVAMARELASENVRMIADPAPLGLGCFALTTFLLSLFNAGLLPAAGEPIVFGVALAYGGVTQVLAGMWEFRKGNVFGATAFTSYGAFWLSFWAFVTFYAADIPDADDRATAVGWYLIGWGIFTVVLWVASLRTTAVLALLFTLLATTFFVLGAGDVAHNDGLTTIGGYLGLVTAAVAWYACLAGVTASTFGRAVLPNPPLYKL
jgi:succinate-acetate transporter protein